MNSPIIKMLFNEFATTIIAKFEMETTQEELYAIWHEKKKLVKYTVTFDNKPIVDTVEPESDVAEVEVAIPKKVVAKVAVKKSPKSTTCPYKTVRGPNRDSVCGKNTTKDSIMCSAHKKHADKYVKPSDDESDQEEVPATKKEVEKKKKAVPKSKGVEPSSVVAPTKISAKKDDKGRLVLNGDYPLHVKSASELIMIGKIVNDKSVPLSQDDIEFCKSKRLKFETTISKKSIEDVIDEVTGVENDNDEESEKETDDEILEMRCLRREILEEDD